MKITYSTSFGAGDEVLYEEVVAGKDGKEDEEARGTRKRIAYITLNRPEKRNALSMEMLNALCDAMDEASKPEVGAVVMRGNGKCFSAGHDLREIAESEEKTVRTIFENCYRLMRKIRLIPKPVIAKVHGYAVAAGCQLVAACDMAVAAESAKFSLPGVKIGLFCTTPLAVVSRVVGRKKAFEMAFTGEMLDAREAERMGLVNRVVRDEELERETFELAKKVSSYSSSVIGKGKEFFYKQYCMNEFDALLYGIDVIVEMSRGEAAKEGLSAFFEKREPEWPD